MHALLAMMMTFIIYIVTLYIVTQLSACNAHRHTLNICFKLLKVSSVSVANSVFHLYGVLRISCINLIKAVGLKNFIYF